MNPVHVETDPAFFLAELKASEGWRLFTQAVAKKQREKVDTLVKSVKAHEQTRIAEIQGELRFMEWVLDSSLAEIESSLTKKEGK